MDHLPLPKGAMHDLVPFVCSREYDKGDFLTYPLRLDPPRPDLMPSVATINVLTQPSRNSDAPLDDLLQTWLFFGLLWEIFGGLESFSFDKFVCEVELPSVHEAGLGDDRHAQPAHPHELLHASMQFRTTSLADNGTFFCRGHRCSTGVNHLPIRGLRYRCDVCPDFTLCTACKVIDQNDHDSHSFSMMGKIITTSPLHHFTALWLQETKTLDDQPRTSRCQHLLQCLNRTEWAIFTVRRFGSDTVKLYPQLQLSLSVLAEWINFALHVVDKHLLRLVKYDPRPITDKKASDMIQNGYCPNEVQKVRSVASVTASYYLSKLQLGRTTGRHDKCTKSVCHALQTDPSTYVVRHRNPTCTCELFKMDLEAMKMALVAGSYPLLRIKRSNHGVAEVDVVAASQTTQYVAISHVWTDGLGNPYENALYECQMLFVLQQVTQLILQLNATAETEHEKISSTEVMLWIDTICCPVKPPAMKKLGLERIRDVYSLATHVLVLDDSLCKLNAQGISGEELCARIYVAPWNRRLWTLQEAALVKPSRLRIKLKDFAFSMERIDSIDRDIYAYSIGSMIISIELSPKKFILAGMADRHAEDLVYQRESLLEEVAKAAGLRSVSEAADEPLCLAAILGLDLSKILQSNSSDHRMRILWRMILESFNEIPSDVILSMNRRLNFEGFRWASATFLGNTFSAFLLPTGKTGSLTDEGLKVQLPGFRLIRKRKKMIYPEELLFLRLSDACWYRLGNVSVVRTGPDQCKDTDDPFKAGDGEAIVLFSDDIVNADPLEESLISPHRALLGCLGTSRDGKKLVTSFYSAEIQQVSAEPYETGYQISEVLRKNQVIEVDGLESSPVTNDIFKAMEDTMAKSNAIVEACLRESPSLSAEMIGMITYRLHWPFCTIEEVFSSSTEWIVD